MVALALPRRKDTGSGQSTPVSEVAPSIGTPTINGKHSPDLVQADGVEAQNERLKPKRSSSFGRGLGGLASFTSGMSRAGDMMSLGRSRSGASTPQSSAPLSPGENLSAASSVLTPGTVFANPSMGPPSTPDPSHLTQFSLKLSDLVNKAFGPCSVNAQPASNGSVASNVAAAAKGATALASSNQSVPKMNQIHYEGKHLPDKAKIIEIAQTVVGELRYAEAVDAYLLRAVSRQILKALTLFAARIDSLLVSPTKDPSAVKIPTNSKEGLNLPAAMEFNLGLVTLEWIVEDALERCIEGDRDAHGELIADEQGNVHDGMPHFVSEILTPVRKKMEGTILHIIQPILAQTKTSIARCISSAVPTPFVKPIDLSPTITPGTLLSSGSDNGAAPPSPLPGNVSPPVRPLGPAGDLSCTWLRELEGRLDGARRLLLPRIEERCGQDGEGWFISVAIHIIWKGLLILTSRSVALPSNAVPEAAAGTVASASAFERLMGEVNQKRSPSPAQLTQALKAVGVGSTRIRSKEYLPGASESGRQTPSIGRPKLSELHALAPFSLVSSRLCAHQLAELQMFEKLMLRFCEGFLRKPGTQGKKVKGPKRSRFMLFASSSAAAFGGNQPSLDLSAYDPDEEDELARAALAEAMHALKSTIIVLESMERDTAAVCAGLEQLKTLPNADGKRDDTGDDIHTNLSNETVKALDAIPNLLLLQILYNRLPTGPGRLELPNPPALFGYSWTDYEKAIAGFAGGEQWAQAVALRYKPEIEKAWRGISIRKAERITALEEKGSKTSEGAVISAGAGTGVGAGAAASATARVSRSVSATSQPGSPLAQSDSLPSEEDEELDESAQDAMSQSVPVLKKPESAANGDHADAGTNVATKARSSETDLSKAVASSDEVAPSKNAAAPILRGRLSPPRSPRRSVTLAHPAASSSGSAAPAPSNPPRFWRRSSSNARTGFHLTFSGLRSSSPRGALATPDAASTLPEATTPTGSDGATTMGITAPYSAPNTPPRETGPGATSRSNHHLEEKAKETEMSEMERIDLEFKLEKMSLCMFAKAVVYAGRGGVSLDLR